MQIVKTSNPDAALALLPLYVEVDGMDRKALAEQLYIRLCNQPDDTLVIALTESNFPVGFAVAYADEKEVSIRQAYCLPTVDKRWVDISLGVIIGWAKIKGFNKITGKPNRTAKLWKRRWGFEIADDGSVYKTV